MQVSPPCVSRILCFRFPHVAGFSAFGPPPPPSFPISTRVQAGTCPIISSLWFEWEPYTQKAKAAFDNTFSAQGLFSPTSLTFLGGRGGMGVVWVCGSESSSSFPAWAHTEASQKAWASLAARSSGPQIHLSSASASPPTNMKAQLASVHGTKFFGFPEVAEKKWETPPLSRRAMEASRTPKWKTWLHLIKANGSSFHLEGVYYDVLSLTFRFQPPSFCQPSIYDMLRYA